MSNLPTGCRDADIDRAAIAPAKPSFGRLICEDPERADALAKDFLADNLSLTFYSVLGAAGAPDQAQAKLADEYRAAWREYYKKHGPSEM